jgi:Tol biopolymer transport system component
MVTFCSAWLRPDVAENIYVMRADGSDLRALTSDVGRLNRLPRWAADGRQILFYSSRAGECCDIWSVDRDGGELRRVTETGKPTMYAIPARAGSRAFAIHNMAGGFQFDFAKPWAGQQIDPVAAYPEPGVQFWPLDWSADDKLLVGSVASSDDSVTGLFTWSAATRTYDKVVDGGGGAVWLPDGKRIVATDDKWVKLWLVDLGKKSHEDIWSLAPELFQGISVSADGEWLYFSRIAEDGDVWMADL